MKIAIIISNLQQGGITSAFISLTNELSKYKDLEVDAFIFGKKNTSRHIINQKINVIFPSKLLDVWWSGSRGLSGVSLLTYKILHYSGMKMNYFPWKLATYVGKKFYGYDVAIVYENDIAHPNINFMCNDFTLNRIHAVKKYSWIHNDPYKLGYTRDYCLKRYKDFDGIVSVSQGNKDKFEEICPDYKDKSFLVYNCINFEEKQPQQVKRSKKDKKFHIISVSRLSNEQKRIDRMIDTCAILKERGYRDKFVWHMYGTGSDERMLRAYSKEKDVNDVFVFEGFTNKPMYEMARCDLYVMTSDYEGYSLTILEAFCQEVPVVVTNFPEAHESVIDGKNGYIVGFDPEEIANAIADIIEDECKLSKLCSYLKIHPISNDKALREFFDLINHN